MKKYHFVYKTTNKINNKIYIGKHSTDNLDEEYIKEWCSSMEVERELSINHSSITQCCKGNRKSAGKFKWKYKE